LKPAKTTYLLEDWDGFDQPKLAFSMNNKDFMQQQKWWYVVVLNILNSNFGALATFSG
jgi:hypothetical protein